MNPIDNIKPGYPFGAFEDVEIQELTVKMVKDHDKQDREGDSKGINKELFERAKVLVRERNEKGHLWGFKNALTYRCLDYYLPLIDNPLFVVVFRNVLHTASSFQRLLKESYEENITHYESIVRVVSEQVFLISVLEKIANRPIFMVTFEDLEKYFLKICIGLSCFIGITPDYSAFKKLSDLYVSKEKRHCNL